jgi:ParB family chromosome partitioning protein
MKSVDALRARFGGNMRESVGADAPAFPGLPAASGPDAERLRGVSGLKRAFQIPVDRLTPDPDQPRREFDPAALEDLAASLRERGQLQPIRVRWDAGAARWVIVSGERRWRAAVAAGLAALQCVEAKGDMTADEILEDQLVENCLREDLRPVDQARAFKALMDARGWSHRQLGERLHIAPSAVSQALALLRLPEDVRARVDEGALPPATAYELSKVGDPGAQAELVDRVLSEGLSRAETAEAVRRASGRSGAARAKGRGAGRGRKVTSRAIRTGPGPRVVVEFKRGLTAELTRAALADALARVDAELSAGDQAAA